MDTLQRATTAKGLFTHFTVDGTTTLCGKEVVRLLATPAGVNPAASCQNCNKSAKYR